ncbi:MAG: metallophosphoesterase [Bacilli bacterium]|nr:metallophosphoesterase [Bacilli bacterium]
MTREELNEDIQKEIIKEERQAKIKKIIKMTFKYTLILILALTAFFSYNSFIATKKIKVREYRIKNQKIPDSFNGTKIIQFSDLHLGTTMQIKDLNNLIKLINERKPDLVVFTGDLIESNHNLESKEQESLIKKLKNITATLGKYAILGDEDTEKISTIFNQSDFTILRDEYDLIYKNNNESILLLGLSSSLSNKQDIEKAYSYFREETHNSNIFTISLLHEPDSVDNIISSYHSDLFLAGHSLNGSVRIPFFNYSIIKPNGAKKYYQDYYKLNDSELYISSGLGSKTGIRLFCRPSINFYRLTNKSA